MLEYEYARSALKNGLKLGQELGTNPYHFGMIGSTDAHTGLATADQDNFFGKTSSSEPSPERAIAPVHQDGQGDHHGLGDSSPPATPPCGRPTTPATPSSRPCSGARPTPPPARAWRFASSAAGISRPRTRRTACPRPSVTPRASRWAATCPTRPAGKSPTFLVAALRDPIGANLDRVQVVKGWLSKDGELHEKVYDVAWGGDRKPDPKSGKLPPVGDTVDVAEATWTNTIGAPELATVWKDPDFDPSQRAFYYARVIEIPTPRWTAYDAKRFGIKMDAKVPMEAQQRAYTSPIWYTPAK